MRSTITKSLSGIAVVAAAGIAVVGLAPPASAHHPEVSGEAVCNEETGKFDLTWSIGNSEHDKVMTFTTNRDEMPEGTIDGDDETVTWVETVAPGSGPHSLAVDAHWPETGFKKSDSVTVSTDGECAKDEPSEAPEPSETPEPSDDETTSLPPATGPATTEPPAGEPTTEEAADEPTKAGPAFPEDGPGGDGAGPTDGVPTRIPAGGIDQGGVGEDEIDAASTTTNVVGQPVVLGLVGLGAGMAAIGGAIGALRVRARQD